MWESETLLVTIVLLDFLLLSSARFSALVAYAAAQGVLLGLLVLSLGGLFASPWRVWLLAIVSAWLKGFVFPALLKRATRDVNVQREERPFVGFSASLLFGLVLFGFSSALANRLPLPSPLATNLLLSSAFFTMLCGLFLLTARRSAVAHVLGYLVLENGVFLAGLALTREAPLSVELGILLDIFLGLFIMGILIYHIGREFATLDTVALARMAEEKE